MVRSDTHFVGVKNDGYRRAPPVLPDAERPVSPHCLAVYAGMEYIFSHYLILVI